jgi:hypothetical protein
MSAVSSVGDLGGGYIKESLKMDEKGRVWLPRGGNVVSCARLEGCVVSSARQIRTTPKDGEKGKTKYQQHVMAGAPMRKSVPFHVQLRRTSYTTTHTSVC